MKSLISSIQAAQQAIKQVVIGQDHVIDLMFIALLANGHIILESVPGSGKTKLAKSLAKVIKGQFSRVQFTPDVLPSDVTGIQFFNPKTKEFEMRTGPAMTNLLLADEINRATPKTQSSLLEVMEENQLTIDGETLFVPSPFLVIATQNPVENNQGTFPLPEAQLDRFLFKVNLDYPEHAEEKAILSSYQERDPFHDLSYSLKTEDIVELQGKVNNVTFSDILKDYLLALVRESRQHPDVRLGASTRAALALMKASRAQALLQERAYVVPQDVKDLAPYVLEHRLVLSMEGAIRRTKKEVALEIIQGIEVPVEVGSYER
ncbi:MoxR family ATPase [Aquibacillus sp. 3ASR75-11]|uniref:MoxR family ATPase n=1 Tax=Terrihalobacillus insolitus TaxID=2950438 RepID=A0A9X3WPX0_9BACI|nr:MoxR family ATPase [Terrihalobacillus insolitus]MDC3412886.1 MoxR family ATPase [Terrihalobacillus insolitus]MDC3423635.1 MoxR family ATPase [Terrihalobacillus insolitus]